MSLDDDAPLALKGSLDQDTEVPSRQDLLARLPQRADVMASVAHSIGGSASGYFGVGRSLSSLAEGGTSLALNGGISVRFNRSHATP